MKESVRSVPPKDEKVGFRICAAVGALETSAAVETVGTGGLVCSFGTCAAVGGFGMAVCAFGTCAVVGSFRNSAEVGAFETGGTVGALGTGVEVGAFGTAVGVFGMRKHGKGAKSNFILSSICTLNFILVHTCVC
jgi:hypothetical protein